MIPEPWFAIRRTPSRVRPTTRTTRAFGIIGMLANPCLQPCTLREFMNYLKYIELAAENLQFFLWYKDYVKRFDDLQEGERKLSPEWTLEQAEAEALAAQTQPRAHSKLSPETAAMFKGTDFESQARVNEMEKANPFYTPPRTPSGESSRNDEKSMDQSYTTKSSYVKRAEGAFDEAGLKWQPCKTPCH